MRTIALIPTRNEQEHIASILTKSGRHVDRIIVIDSSTDSTPDIISKDFPDVNLIRESRRGKGIAVRRGISLALSMDPENILLMDGDGERDPDDIPRLIDVLGVEGADVALGNRETMRSGRRSLLNRFGLSWIRLLTGYRIGDAFSGFIAFRRQTLENLSLRAGGFDIEAEILLESWKRGFRVSEMPVRVPKLSRSGLLSKDMLRVNMFFDCWVLMNLGSLPRTKRLFFFIPCLIGLFLSWPILLISGQR